MLVSLEVAAVSSGYSVGACGFQQPEHGNEPSPHVASAGEAQHAV